MAQINDGVFQVIDLQRGHVLLTMTAEHFCGKIASAIDEQGMVYIDCVDQNPWTSVRPDADMEFDSDVVSDWLVAAFDMDIGAKCARLALYGLRWQYVANNGVVVQQHST